MTTRSQIAGWFDRGVAQGATHMIVKWDSFEGPFDADYPVYVMPGQDPRVIDRENGDRTVECYNLRLNRESQLAEHRAFHWEMDEVSA